MRRKKLAVVLMNLGGPDSLQNVRPFLSNLFSDPAIIGLPNPFRYLVAKLISRRREKKAQEIYRKLGGQSPLLENTQAQQQALEGLLHNLLPDWECRVFIAMRYWHPLSAQTWENVQTWGADQIVALPLYPQFSTTTTASSLKLWRQLAPDTLTLQQGCYFQDPGFITAYQDLIDQEIKAAPSQVKLRLLFSAHGIPQKLVDNGDPYQWQVEQSVAAIMANFEIDHRICYQSRVGPLKWLNPSLEAEIEQAAQEKVGIIIVPITFVSEHSETLVELDMDFKEKSSELGIPFYGRVATVGTHPEFIAGLARLVKARVETQLSYQASLCPPEFKYCGCRG
ncbi:ferrochelatase [Candidatus Odyssella thessalonicensis]|uniref:ferrochelatase n=1 Tax=Candidatus Odyssella thessalonicensis TaxID=84647 RepID=UPI000225C206|nr:ferrochelatase [Candidatus Odyssella thessalonicensis]